MLIFLLQLMAPEKYGRPDTPGGKAESGKQKVEIETRSTLGGEGTAPAGVKRECRTLKIETESKQLSVVIDQSAAGVSVAADPGSGGVRAERPGSSSEMPELRGDFVPQDIGGELVMREDCPEFPTQCASGGEAPEGPAIKIKSMIKSKTGGNFVGEVSIQEPQEEKASAGTAAGKGGILDLDLNHDLDQSGSGTPSFSEVPSRDIGKTPEIPESSRDVNSQVIDGENVTDVEKPICPPVARRNEGVASRDRRGREPAATDACHALIGLGDCWERLTWACARRTRFSPGYHVCGLQPRRRGSVPHRIRLRRGGGKTPELRGDFISYNADDQ